MPRFLVTALSLPGRSLLVYAWLCWLSRMPLSDRHAACGTVGAPLDPEPARFALQYMQEHSEWTGPSPPLTCRLFHRAGSRLASGGADKTIRLWDPLDGRPTGTLEGMQEVVTELSFSCDSRSLLASGSDHAVRMFTMETSRVRHTLTGHSAKVCVGMCGCVGGGGASELEACRARAIRPRELP